MIIITEQVYETTRENISNRLITIITIIKKNILKYEKNFSNINGLNLYIICFFFLIFKFFELILYLFFYT